MAQASTNLKPDTDERPWVLIVDDSRVVRRTIMNALRQTYNVLEAENGVAGWSVLRQNSRIELVISDIEMPELDGYATTEAIRATTRFSRLPIIALTAKAMKGDREKSIASGASDYVTKPVDIDQLLSLMRVWLYR